MAESDKVRNIISQKQGVFRGQPGNQYRNSAQGFHGNNPRVAPSSRAYIERPQAKHVQQKKKIQKNRTFLRTMIIVVFSILIIIFISMNWFREKADEIKGTWSFDSVTVYHFDGKGTGELILPTAQYAFTYTLEDSTLHIDFLDEKIRDAVYTFSVENEGLILTGTDGETQFHLQRQ